MAGKGAQEALRLFVESGASYSVAEFKGNSIAVDVNSWLKKAIYSYMDDMIESNFDDYMLYVDFLLFRARNFRMAGVEPVMVFSGQKSSLKGTNESVESESQSSAIEQGKRLLECLSKTTDASCQQKIRHEATVCFQRGIQITPEIERNCIAALRRVGVLVVVAPYDAAAQMASLCHSGICHAVLTEDTDLILYSAISEKPFPVLYNFESTGKVQVVSLSAFAANERGAEAQIKRAKKASPDRKSSKVPTTSSPLLPVAPKRTTSADNEVLDYMCKLLQEAKGRRQLLQMCLLLGNDYIEPLFEGITPATAQSIMMKFDNVPSDERLSSIVKFAHSLEGMASFHQINLKDVPDTSPYALPTFRTFPLSNPRSPKANASYLERLTLSEAMFYYHPVYDPKLKAIKNILSPNYSIPGGKCMASGPYPAVTPEEVFRLGHSAHILHGIPTRTPNKTKSVTSLQCICEGLQCIHTFQEISPRFPWEVPRIGQYSSQRATLLKTSSGSNSSICSNSNNSGSSNNSSSGGNSSGNSGKGVWPSRAMLVRSLGNCLTSISPDKDESSSSVSNLLSPCREGVPRPHPASLVFATQLEQFQAASRRQLQCTEAPEEESESPPPSRRLCYKSPPSSNKKRLSSSSVLMTVRRDGARDSDTSGHSGQTEPSKREMSHGDGGYSSGKSGSAGVVPPLSTPPGVSTAQLPLSPDLSRLANIANRSSSKCQSTKQAGGEPLESSLSGKRKPNKEGGSSEVQVSKKKRKVVTSIKSYFRIAS